MYISPFERRVEKGINRLGVRLHILVHTCTDNVGRELVGVERGRGRGRERLNIEEDIHLVRSVFPAISLSLTLAFTFVVVAVVVVVVAVLLLLSLAAVKISGRSPSIGGKHA